MRDVLRVRSLRRRVAAVVGLSMLVVLAAAAFGLHHLVEDRLVARAEREAREGVMSASTQLSAGITPLELMTGPPGNTFVRVTNGDRMVAPTHHAAGDSVGQQLDPLVPAEELVVERFDAVGPVDEGDVLVERRDVGGVPMVVASIIRSDAAGASVSVMAATPLDETIRTLATLRTASWIAVPLVALGLALLAWLLVGRALRPVDRMRAEADRISHGTLHHRLSVPQGSVDELGRLAGTMNAMLDRLERSQQRQRQFVSDASHELRSPLATAQALLEVDGSEDARAAALAQVQRLGSLVDDLLALARLDEVGPVAVDVDLDEVVLDEVAQRGDAGATVDLRGVGPARVVADPTSIRRVVRNLVDNACRHARSRVEVTVRLEETAVDGGGHALLVVDDDGPGIPQASRAQAFERFARLDEGRARDEGGVGIGLALVRSVALAHGGSVEIADAPIGGARVAVRLPLASRGAGDGGR